MATIATLTLNLIAKASGLKSELSSSQRAVQDLGRTAKSTEASMSGFGKNLIDGLDRVKKKLDDVEQNLSDFGGNLSAAVTAPILGVGTAALKMSIDLNRTMANVASLGVPTERIYELKDAVQELAVDTGKGTDDIADGLYQVISTFEDTADTTKILDIVARSAAAGLATTTDAINLTASVSKSYNDTSIETIQKINDLAFATANLGITTLPEMARNMGQVSPLAASLGVSMEEMFAVMATGAGITGSTSEVATQFRGILQSFLAPTAEATKLIKALGFANGQAMVKQLGFQKSMEILVAAAKATNQPLQTFISSIEGQTLAMALAGEQQATFTQRLQDMQNVEGQMDAAFEAQTQGVNKLGFALQQARVKMQVFFEKLGDALGPTAMEFVNLIEPWSEKLLKLADSFAALNPETRRSIIIWAGIAAAIGPALVALGAFVGFVSSALPVIGAFAGVLGALLSPLGLVVAGLAALVILDVGGIQTTLSTMFGEIQAFATAVPEALAGAQQAFVSFFAAMEADVLAVAGELGRIFTDISAAITSFASGDISFDQFVTEITTSLGEIGAAIKELFDGGELAQLFTQLGDAVQPLLDTIPTITGGIAKIQEAFSVAWTAIQPTLQQISVGIGLVSMGFTIAAGVIGGAWQQVVDLFGPSVTRIQEAFTTMTTELGKLGPSFQRLGEAAQPVLSGLGQIATFIGGAIAVGLGVVAVTAINFLAATFENLSTIVEAVVEAITAQFTLISTVVTEAITGVTALLNGDWATAWQSAQNILQAFVDFGQSTFGAFLLGLGATVGIIGTTISTTLSDLGFADIAADVEWATTKVQEFIDWLGKIVSGDISLGITMPGWLENLANGTWSWPTLPEFAWPTLPDFSWPELPSWDWPSMPEFSWPSLPTWTWPSIPTPAWLDNLLNWRPPNLFGFGGSTPGQDALGDNYSAGGWTWVGEQGPELLRLPRGAQVLSHPDSMKMIGNLASGNVTLPAGFSPAQAAGFANYVANNLAEQSEKNADKTATKIAREMERAIEKQTQKLRSVLQGVPGLFGTSSVTDDQMRLAELGVPQNFADNYLRRLTDEVLNGVDWEGVDIMDAAARANIDPTLPQEVILELFKQSWANQSLFADPKNLDLIDMSAVQEHMDLQKRSEQGRANIFGLFGITPEDATGQAALLGGNIRTGLEQSLAGGADGLGLGTSLINSMASDISPEKMAPVTTAIAGGLSGSITDQNTSVGGALVGMINAQLSEEDVFGSTAQLILNQITGSWGNAEFNVDIAGPMARAMQNNLGLQSSVDSLMDIGETVLEIVFKGYQEAASGVNWVGAIPAASSASGGSVPGNALGTAYWGGGMMRVGETGPEYLIAPRGAQVVPERDMVGASGGPLIGQVIVQNQADEHRLAYRVNDLLERRRRSGRH